MSESSNDQTKGRAIVIQRGSELAEFVQGLEELSIPVEVHADPALPSLQDVAGAAVVVVSGTRLLDGRAPNLSLWPRTLAVVDDASRTLLAQLKRVGAALVIRRPIHARTLRLLLIHEMYRGPERRRRPRVLIGHPIRIGVGLFKQRATLLDLSAGGARIELPRAPKVGTKLNLLLPKELTRGKPLKMQAKVVRCIRTSADTSRPESELGVALVEPRKHLELITPLLARFATGPASWSGKRQADPSDSPTPDRSSPGPDEKPSPRTGAPEEASPRSLPPSYVAPPSAPSQEAPRSPGEEKNPSGDEVGPVQPVAEAQSNRRHDARIPYARRVVTLGDEATRVLVGRDLSKGGMRVAPTEAVEVGDTLRVALHCGSELEPLVLLATALRDDGEAGIVLGFESVSGTPLDHLEKIIASSSPVHTGQVDDFNASSGSVFLSEVLEKVSAAPADGGEQRPPAAVSTDEEIEAHLDSIFEPESG